MPTSSVPPAGTVTGSQAGTSVPSTVSVVGAPATQTRRGVGEVQAGAGHGELQPGRTFGVAERLVAEAEGEVIHRAAGRNAYLPQAGTAGPVLDGGLQAGPLHGDPGFRIAHVIQGAGGVGRVADHVQGGHGAEHPEVCLDTVDPGGSQRGAEPVEGLVPVRAGGDDLGQQGVVVGGHLAAGFHPGVHAHPVGHG